MTNILKFAFYIVCSIYGSSFIVLMLLLRHWMNAFIIDPDYSSLFAMSVANTGIIVGSIGMPVLFHFYREAKRKDDWYNLSKKKCLTGNAALAWLDEQKKRGYLR